MWLTMIGNHPGMSRDYVDPISTAWILAANAWDDFSRWDDSDVWND